MHRVLRLALPSLASLAILSASASARAQNATGQLSPAPPPPVSAQAPNGEYTAPLSQETQPTYVPQSVALSGPRVIKNWNEGEPMPAGYHPVQRVRTGFIAGGASMLVSLYLLSALVASVVSDASQGSQQDTALYVPAIGPFIQMTSTSSATGNFVLAIDGAVQSAGLAMLIYGIASPRTVLVRNDLATAPRVLPIRLGRDGYGLGLVARF